ncbi:MAG: histidine kinase [Clostridium sp.]|nr:histidine kinase [Clostridium sp.]
MITFIRSAGLVTILTAAAMFSSKQPYLCLLLAGLLMMILAMEGVSDLEENTLPELGKTLLAAVFAAIGGTFLSFLLFYVCRFGKKKWWLFAPGILYALWGSMVEGSVLSVVICGSLILELAAFALWMLEWTVCHFLLMKQQAAKSIQVTAVNEMYEKKLNQELQLKNYLAEKNARLEERETISRNIHNSVGHSVTAAIMTLEAADMLFFEEPERAREKVNIAKGRIRESLESIRHAVRVLDVEKKAVSGTDFIKEISDITDSFVMDTAITVKRDIAKLPEKIQIPHEHTEFLAGAVQELFTNGVRHGKADTFILHISGDSRHVKVAVQDNGASDFNEENAAERIRKGFGIKKLAAYVQRCGGRLQYRNEHGFLTEIELPIPAAEEDLDTE